MRCLHKHQKFATAFEPNMMAIKANTGNLTFIAKPTEFNKALQTA